MFRFTYTENGKMVQDTVLPDFHMAVNFARFCKGILTALGFKEDGNNGHDTWIRLEDTEITKKVVHLEIKRVE